MGGAEMGITFDNFLAIMGTQLSDTDVLEQFIGASGGDEAIASPDCRSALAVLASQRLGADSFTEQRWDRIFDSIMWDAEPIIPLEKWTEYCGKLARIVRVYQLRAI